jgi:hypothetical protein
MDRGIFPGVFAKMIIEEGQSREGKRLDAYGESSTNRVVSGFLVVTFGLCFAVRPIVLRGRFSRVLMSQNHVFGDTSVKLGKIEWARSTVVVLSAQRVRKSDA